jgi:hypothetical protein
VSDHETAFPHLFIWYIAPDGIEPVLRQWLNEVETQLGVHGELFLRRDQDNDGNPRTTFMETYREVDETFISALETLAKAQPWQSQLLTPRRCEAFDRIE